MGPYDCRMPVRFLQMQSRDARAGLIAALLLVPLCVAPTAVARWSAPARPAGCSAALAAAAAPSVVFPDAGPTVRSGSGVLLWTAPRGCASGASAGEAFGATLAGDDLPGMGRSLTANAGGPRKSRPPPGRRRGRSWRSVPRIAQWLPVGAQAWTRAPSQRAEQRAASQKTERRAPSQRAKQRARSQRAKQRAASQKTERRAPSQRAKQRARSQRAEQRARSGRHGRWTDRRRR